MRRLSQPLSSTIDDRNYVRYYKQLQSISDSLKEAEWSGSVDEAIAASNTLQAELDGKIKTGKARERYV